MVSVKHWAKLHQYDYQLIGDEFFNYAPEWFRHAVNNQRHLVADLARLEMAQEYLQQDWQRVIWVDADVL